MLNELSIKVNIANRFYPLKVNNTQQEELLRKAAKLINEKLKTYANQFSVNDQQDMLSMAVLDVTAQLIALQKQQQDEQLGVLKELQMLQSLLIDAPL